MSMPIASARAHLPADQDRRTDLHIGQHNLRADNPTNPDHHGEGPTPVGLLTAGADDSPRAGGRAADAGAARHADHSDRHRKLITGLTIVTRIATDQDATQG